MDDAFRKIDIDAYDEDAIADDELYDTDPRSSAQAAQEAKGKLTEVRGLLQRSNIPAALSSLLSNYPYGEDHHEAKAQSLSTFYLIVNSTKSSDIPTIVKSLTEVEKDDLMKFIYKGMEKSDGTEVTHSVLLTWHEKLTEVAGVGSIVRVMTDRRRI